MNRVVSNPAAGEEGSCIQGIQGHAQLGVFSNLVLWRRLQRWKSCLRVTASASVELLSHIVSMQDQLAEYHSYSTGLQGLIFFFKECRVVEGRGTRCFLRVVMHSHKLSLVNKLPAHL